MAKSPRKLTRLCSPFAPLYVHKLDQFDSLGHPHPHSSPRFGGHRGKRALSK
ncbi:hypothetical protein BD779DRAFT_1550573 [Infundibulicybe gibba]|nr:hypothetical protein BD779DRAFT_1550573 [Infundibulicybe gibba]